MIIIIVELIIHENIIVRSEDNNKSSINNLLTANKGQENDNKKTNGRVTPQNNL